MQASTILESGALATLFQAFSPMAWAILAILAVISVFALSVVVAKLAQFSRARVGDARQPRAALAAWQAGDHAGALALCQQGRGLRLAVLGALLTQIQRQPGAAQMAAIQRGSEGLETLSRHMRGLEGVVQAAPMLGLLGTVIGMIEAFGKLAATSGAADPSQLAGGIWTALITTALGLAIAIVFYLISLWLEGRITAESHAIERLISAALLAMPAAAEYGGSAPRAAPASWPQTAPQTAPEPASPFGTSPAQAPGSHSGFGAPKTLPPGAFPQQIPPAGQGVQPRQPPGATHGVTVIQPMPGGRGQRTDPGRINPAPAPTDPRQSPETGAPPPEGFRPRR